MEYYVVVWQDCDICQKEPNDGKAVRIQLDVVERAGEYKYMHMICPNCSNLEYFKRSCWYGRTDTILDTDNVERKVVDLPDYTMRVRSRHGRKLDDFSAHGG